MNVFQKFLNWTTRGAYAEFRNNPCVIKRWEIRRAAKVGAQFFAELHQQFSALSERNRISATALNNRRVLQELSGISIDCLTDVPGIGEGRLQSIKDLGISTLADIRGNPARIQQARGLSGQTGWSAAEFARHKIYDVTNSPSNFDFKEKDVQKLVCTLLVENEIRGKLDRMRMLLEQLNWRSSKYRPVNFSATLLNKQSLTDTGVLEASREAHEILSEISSQNSTPSFLFDTLSMDEYIRGAGLLELACKGRAPTDSRSNKVHTQSTGINPFLKIDQSLVKEIESLALNKSHMQHCVLRAYQEFAAKFIVIRKFVAIGDEMGLGKTIQVLAALSHLWATSNQFRALVLVPASLSENWRREIESKTDLPCFPITGPQRLDVFLQWVQSGGVGITSYSSFRQDLERYNKLDEIDMLVGDEAQYIKNPLARRSEAFVSLIPKARHVVVMTGTPVENHPGDFIHILNALPHGVKALREAGRGGIWPTPSRFREITRSLYLRRNKEDVLKELPELIETEEWVSLPDEELYQHLLDIKENIHIMELRHRVTTGRNNQSAKLDRIFELIGDYRDAGRNLIVFSYFLSVLRFIGNEIPQAGRIHGGLKPAERLSVIDDFSVPSSANVGKLMLCQITSAGMGLNMQAASGVIIAEPQFNPAVEYQAICRAHRMGQRSAVNVHRIIAKNTIEEDVAELLKKKRQYMIDYGRDSLLKEQSQDAISNAEVTSLRVERQKNLESLLRAS